MENKVNIFFFDQLAGELSQDKYGTLLFQYDQEYIAKKGVPISHSMPLTSEIYYGNEAHAYFTGLLPKFFLSLNVTIEFLIINILNACIRKIFVRP